MEQRSAKLKSAVEVSVAPSSKGEQWYFSEWDSRDVKGHSSGPETFSGTEQEIRAQVDARGRELQKVFGWYKLFVQRIGHDAAGVMKEFSGPAEGFTWCSQQENPKFWAYERNKRGF